MAKSKKEEEKIDGVWAFLILSLLFYEPPKPKKVINIYMGDEK